jgi:hypothetical protein
MQQLTADHRAMINDHFTEGNTNIMLCEPGLIQDLDYDEASRVLTTDPEHMKQLESLEDHTVPSTTLLEEHSWKETLHHAALRQRTSMQLLEEGPQEIPTIWDARRRRLAEEMQRMNNESLRYDQQHEAFRQFIEEMQWTDVRRLAETQAEQAVRRDAAQAEGLLPYTTEGLWQFRISIWATGVELLQGIAAMLLGQLG